MAYTPTKLSLSSVFLTPESEKKSFISCSSHTPRPLPSLAALLTPIVTPKCSGAIAAHDVLTQLIEAGMPRTADCILAYLSPSDIIGSVLKTFPILEI